MVLAAGRGQRMMPLTKSTPKPLLQVHAKPLLHFHLQANTIAQKMEAGVKASPLG